MIEEVLISILNALKLELSLTLLMILIVDYLYSYFYKKNIKILLNLSTYFSWALLRLWNREEWKSCDAELSEPSFCILLICPGRTLTWVSEVFSEQVEFLLDSIDFNGLSLLPLKTLIFVFFAIFLHVDVQFYLAHNFLCINYESSFRIFQV